MATIKLLFLFGIWLKVQRSARCTGFSRGTMRPLWCTPWCASHTYSANTTGSEDALPKVG